MRFKKIGYFYPIFFYYYPYAKIGIFYDIYKLKNVNNDIDRYECFT